MTARSVCSASRSDSQSDASCGYEHDAAPTKGGDGYQHDGDAEDCNHDFQIGERVNNEYSDRQCSDREGKN
jgi:hypothetical protein